MEKQNVKRGRGRPPVYKTNEEKREAIKESKTRYMVGKEWYCDICNTGRNYKLAGKHTHLNTNKHSLNVHIMEDKN